MQISKIVGLNELAVFWPFLGNSSNSFDFFSRDYINNKIYKADPRKFEELKQFIREVFEKVLIEIVCQNPLDGFLIAYGNISI